MTDDQDQLQQAITTHNSATAKQLREMLHELHPQLFEQLIGELLDRLGYVDIKVSPYVGDQGIDVRAKFVAGGLSNAPTAIQVKRWRKPVGAPLVQQLRGSLSTTSQERGLLITLSTFTKQAVDESNASGRIPISLVDGDRLIDLMFENDLAVVERPVMAYDIDPEFAIQVEESVEPMIDTRQTVELADSDGRRAAKRVQLVSAKGLWLWPLPGGGGSYVDTLALMLNFIMNFEPDSDRSIEWMRDKFPTVKSAAVIRQYMRVPEVLGLTLRSRNRYFLTPIGELYLGTRDDDLLASQLLNRIAGVQEMYDACKMDVFTVTKLREMLNELEVLSVKTDAQVQWRVNWLYSLGLIRKTAEGWTAMPE